MVEGLRPGLYKAYQAEYGSTNIPERVLTPTEEYRKRYLKHGLVSIHVPLDGIPTIILIDTVSLLFMGSVTDSPRMPQKPRFAWVKRRTPESFDIIVTSQGGSRLPRKYGRADCANLSFNGEDAEAVLAIVDYNVSPNRQIPYDVKLEALHVQQPTPKQS